MCDWVVQDIIAYMVNISGITADIVTMNKESVEK